MVRKEIVPCVKAQEVLARLRQEYPQARCGLDFTTPFELLVATILSAQCTDDRVNMVTQNLFPKARTPEAILALGEEALQEEIRECGLFRNKAKNIIGTCQMILAEYGGDVPSDFVDLVRLPGVGRKTANVVLSNAFGTPAFPVDTHVFRVSNRIGLTPGKNPKEVEDGWVTLLDEGDWYDAHHLLIWHGRNVCKARQPLCRECVIIDLCATGQTSL